MNKDFWLNRRVFVTGHSGFKGSWLCLWLLQKGCQVTGYSLAPHTEPALFLRANVEQGMHSVLGDVRNEAALKIALMASEAEVVIHMAAQPLVRRSYEEPVMTYATNVMGTVHLLEAVRQTPSVKAVVIVTTDKCYENREWVWPYREDESLGGYDPYSNSKACSELVVNAYRQSFFNTKHGAAPVAIATARAGNVIGGGDWSADRLIPDILRSFSKDQLAHIRNPEAIRPWQHVLEPLAGYLTLAENLYLQGNAFSQAWNFGPNQNDARSVRWVADTMGKLWGDGKWTSTQSLTQPHEAKTLRLDISKAGSLLKWSPLLSIETALDWTVYWSKKFMANADAHDLCAQQILQYESMRTTRGLQ